VVWDAAEVASGSPNNVVVRNMRFSSSVVGTLDGCVKDISRANLALGGGSDSTAVLFSPKVGCRALVDLVKGGS